MTNLARSMSLNINTGGGSSLFGNSAAQNNAAGSLFTSTSQPQTTQSGGLFGSTGATSQAGGGGLFAKLGSNSQPAAGGLFGAAPTTSTGGGGLFGSNTTASTQPAAGGLFGSAPTISQSATGGLFGGAPAATQQQQSGGLFGSAPTATQQPSTGGLFGGLNTSKPATSGLFGAAPATTQPQSTSLFGNNTAPAASTSQPTNSLFGNLNKPAGAGPTLGGSLFGGSTTQPGPGTQLPQSQSTVQAVTVSWENVKPTTRFSELHPSVQEQLCQLDDAIQLQIIQSTQISEFMPRHGETVASLPGDVAYLEQRLDTVQGAIYQDVRDTEKAKQLTKSVIDDARVAFGAIENLRLPAQFQYVPGHYGSAMNASQSKSAGGALSAAGIRVEDSDEQTGSTRDLLAYFRAKVEDLAQRMDTYTRQIRELEDHIATVEVSAVEQIQRAMIRRQSASRLGGGKDSSEGSEAASVALEFKKERLRELAGALRGLEDAILRVAGRVGEAREGVVDCQFPERSSNGIASSNGFGIASRGGGGGGGGWR